MSDSSNETNNAVVEYVTSNFDASTKIIDIGAGAGKMWDLFHKTHPNIDAIEIWEPNIGKFLDGKYNNIFNINCIDFENYADYNLAIIGDMLEHLVVEDAQKLVDIMPQNVIIVVPYVLTKKCLEGNPYQKHEQNDLTKKLMEERFPSLKLHWDNQGKSRTTPNGLGIYIRT
jgi:16S rRNA A1518/A1519 N6-dimethyltransferase RsmA/KsgA/DIM1 with predicted DNA glycosylase/AP lyase activity